MKNYHIIEESSRYNLIEAVESWMELGWVCQGGVHVRGKGFKNIYTQAMVKK